MNYLKYVPFDESVHQKSSLSFSIWHRIKRIGDTIKHMLSIRKSKRIKKETINQVESVNIVGMKLEEAREILSNVVIRDYGADQTQSGCCCRCNVYVDEDNIITEIVSFS